MILSVIAPLPNAAKERHTGLMPGAGQNGVLALWTVYSEEIEGFVMGVGQSEGNDNVSGAQVEGTGEGLLQPELLQFYLTAFLLFILKLDGLVGFVFDGRACSTMLKFYLRPH